MTELSSKEKYLKETLTKPMYEDWKSSKDSKAYRAGYKAGLAKMQKNENFVSYVALASTYSKLSLNDKMAWFRCLDLEGRSELSHIVRDWEGQKSDD